MLCGRAAGQQLHFRATDGEPLAFCGMHSKPTFAKLVRGLRGHLLNMGGPPLFVPCQFQRQPAGPALGQRDPDLPWRRCLPSAETSTCTHAQHGAFCPLPSPTHQVDEMVEGKLALDAVPLE